MNTEKIEKLKKSLSNNLLPADLKPKIEAEIKRLEDLDSKQPKQAVKRGAKKTSNAKPSKTTKPKRTAMSLAKEIRKDGESWKDAIARASKMMKDKSHTATKDVENELNKLAEGGYLTDPTFGTFQNQVFADGGGVDEWTHNLKYLTSKKVYFDITTGKVYPKTNLKPNMSKGKSIDEYDDKWFETLNDRDLATVQNYINNRKEFADGGGVGYSKKERVIDYYYNNDVFDDYETYGLSEDDLNNENKIVKAIIKYHDLDDPKMVKERFNNLGLEEFATGGSINEKTTKMRKQRLKKGDTVFVIGRRWFDRVNGNTYHTAEVEVNGEFVGKSLMTYGYGDNYLETAKEILLEKYDFPTGMTDRSSLWQLREYGVVLNKSVIDGLKRDLAKGGGVKTKNGQTYNYGRVWTKDHNEFDKGSDHEVEYRRKKKFELGGTVVTDLAGHTGGSLGGDPTMLDGMSGTAYTGLVGETGAMSSGEMFANGGALTKYVKVYFVQGNYGSGFEDLTAHDTFGEAKKERKVYDENERNYPHRVIERRVLRTDFEKGNYELGGGLPSGVNQSYMITEAFGNAAQHLAKGGGFREHNGRKYDIGRNWTKDHNEFDKTSEHEVEYRRKKSSFFAKGGAMEKIKYDDVLEVLKEKLEESTEELPRGFDNYDSFTGEEVEKESRDGFIAYTDGGYEVTWFEYMSYFISTGYSLPTKPLDDEMQRQVDYNYQLAKETFVDKYPEIVEELGEENIDYNSLYEAGYESEAEELSEMEMDFDGEDSIMCQIGAYYFNNNNYRGIEGKHTLRLFGVVNLESPYHRRGNLEDSYDIDITFDSISELKEKVDAGLKEIIDWFDGKYYNDSDAEMKIRRMADGGAFAPNFADGGFMDGVYAKGGGVGTHKYTLSEAKNMLGAEKSKNEGFSWFVSDVDYYGEDDNEQEYGVHLTDKELLDLADEVGDNYAKGGGVGKMSEWSVSITSEDGDTFDWDGFAKNEDDALYKAEKEAGFESVESGITEITDSKGNKIEYAKGGEMAKGGKVSPFKNIMETNIITEKEINLIKLRMNNDKVDEATQEVIDYIWDNSPQLTPDQNKKGIDYLRNLWKSPTGKERTNNPFGYREQDALETFEYFELRGFYDAGNRYRKFYVPLYTCVGADSSFEYAFYNGQVNILG